MNIEKSQIRPRFDKITLTDADLLALPTASAGPNGGIILAPAPGVGFYLVPLWANFIYDNHGNVTGIDDPSQILIKSGQNQGTVFAWEDSAFTSGGTDISDLLAGGAGFSSLMLQMYSVLENDGVGTQARQVGGNSSGGGLALSDLTNVPILLFSSNAADYTGGNVANVLTIWLSYLIVNV